MVCKKCEKVCTSTSTSTSSSPHPSPTHDSLFHHQKLSKVAAPDPFTASSSSIKDGSRKVGENKLLSRPGSSRNRFQVLLFSKQKHLRISTSLAPLAHLLRPAPLPPLNSPIRTNVKTVSNQRHKTAPSIVMVCRFKSVSLPRLITYPLTTGCAYKKGLCSICGKQILDTTGYVMSSK